MNESSISAQINFLTYGNREHEAVFFIHGLQSSHETWLAVCESLKDKYFCVTYDQRGHGKTPRKGEDYSVERMAHDLAELMNDLGIEKAHIVGHSMGGRTAMGFAGLYPERCLSMTIEDMGVTQRAERSDEIDKNKLGLARKLHRPTNRFDSIDEIREILTPLYSYAEDLIKNKVTQTDDGKYELKFHPDATVMYGYQGNWSDLTENLKNKNFPILFLQADPQVGSAMNESCVDHIKYEIPGAKIEYFSGAWHSIHKSDFDNFMRVLRSFLA